MFGAFGGLEFGLGELGIVFGGLGFGLGGLGIVFGGLEIVIEEYKYLFQFYVISPYS